jgi:hypothetical protein
LIVENVVTDGFISAVRVTFPVFVAFAWVYTFSFKVIDADGNEMSTVFALPQLQQGANDVRVEIESAAFLAADGPFSVVAVVVFGPGGTASLAELGAPFDASRWQFTPALSGDLDNDLDVDVADRDLLLGFRRESALNPGDRRDLNRDSIINILDARLLTGMACSVDNCFPSLEGEGEGTSAKIPSAPPQRTDRQEQGL